MNVIDSSGWLEYFAAGPNGEIFHKKIAEKNKLLVPVITVYEVFKKMLSERGEAVALEVAAHMRLGKVIDVDTTIALAAAHYSGQFKLPMADALIYATARLNKAIVWTQDEHFQGLEGVEFIPKK